MKHLLTPASFWILTKYHELETSLEYNLQTYELAHSISAIYEFLWDYYANWYVEYLKIASPDDLAFGRVLFCQFVITISPYCPFEAEALWQDFFEEEGSLANFVKDFDWTTKVFNVFFGCYDCDLSSLKDSNWYKEFELIVDFVSDLRSTRGLFAIDPVTKIEVFSSSSILGQYKEFVSLVANSTLLNDSQDILYEVKKLDYSYSIDILKYIKDKNWEIDRTKKLIVSLEKQVLGLELQLSNDKFVDNAEPEIIQEKTKNLQDRKLELLQQQNKLIFLG
jgi:valyl-tRNA synthetase